MTTYSKLGEALSKGEFLITGKVKPGLSCDLSDIYQDAKDIMPYVNAINVSDNPLGNVAMNSMVASYLIQKETGAECIWQLTVRDTNKLGLASSLLGAHALGIRNVLSITGDHPILGNVPECKPVFDLDSTTLIKLIREMVDQKKINGKDIDSAPTLHVGSSVNPNADPPEPEILKLGRKASVGVEFIQTQATYDVDKTIEFLTAIKKYNVPILLGIFPMKDYSVAKIFDETVPGVNVPVYLLDQWKKVSTDISDKKDQEAKYEQLNIEFLKPFISELKSKGLIKGVHCMAIKYPTIFPKLMEVIKG